MRALSASRDQQEQLAKAVVAHVPVLQARNERLKELMLEMGAVASEVAGLNDIIAGKKDDGDAARGPTQADALDVSQTVLGLSARAEALATTAHEAEFEEVATQAHSLHQRLQAIGKKLQRLEAARRVDVRRAHRLRALRHRGSVPSETQRRLKPSVVRRARAQRARSRQTEVSGIALEAARVRGPGRAGEYIVTRYDACRACPTS